jgi:hypothetical protein
MVIASNANRIKGVEVDDSNIADGNVLAYNASSGEIEYVTPGTGSGEVPPSRTISVSGDGLSGGGDFSANRTITLSPATTSIAGSFSAADKTTLDGLHSSQTQNKVYASPNGSTGAPSFRALVAGDIPNIAESQVTSLVADLAAKISQVLVTRTIYVDGVNGNNSSGLIGRFDKPFLTLTAARTAAIAATPISTSPVRIVVRPGVYNEKNLLSNYVNWHFESGATVKYTGTAAGGLFDDSVNGANQAVNCLITGSGTFIQQSLHANSNQADSTVRITNTASVVSIEADLIRDANQWNLGINNGNLGTNTAIDATISAISQIGGTLYVKARRITSDYSAALWWENGDVKIQAEEIIGGEAIPTDPEGFTNSETAAIYPVAGGVLHPELYVSGHCWVEAQTIISHLDACIYPGGSTNARLWVIAKEVVGGDSGSANVLPVYGMRCYFYIEKLTAKTNGVGGLFVRDSSEGGNAECWATILKTNASTRLASGKSWVTIGHVDGGDLNIGSIVTCDNVALSDHHLHIHHAKGGTSSAGVLFNGGLLTLSGKIDTSLCTTTNPILVAHAGLTVQNINLLSNGVRDAITAASAQTVTVRGTVGTNNGINNNITLAGNVFAPALTANTFAGNGVAITALSASNIASGSLADARLSSNVPLKNASNTFSVGQTVTGTLTATTLAGLGTFSTTTVTAANNSTTPLTVNTGSSFSGSLIDLKVNGVSKVNVNDSGVVNCSGVFTTGNVDTAQLLVESFGAQILAGGLYVGGGDVDFSGASSFAAPNVAFKNINNNFSTSQTVTGTVAATTFSGSGSSLTNLPAASLTGSIADARLSANVPLLNVNNAFTGNVATSKRITSGVQTLTLSANSTVAWNADSANTFLVSNNANTTVTIPTVTNNVDGQKMMIRFKNTHASTDTFTVTLTTGTNGFRFGSDVTALTATVHGKTDKILSEWNAADAQWDVIAYSKGF